LTAEAIRELDMPALVGSMGAILSRVKSSDLALRGLRTHVRAAMGSSVHLVTVDCSRPVPSIQLGHPGTAHIVIHIDERAIVPLLAAYWFRDVFEYFHDGSIRLQQGAPGQGPLYTALRLVRDPCSTRENADLRVQLQAALEAWRESTGH
jgi:hypothetical protein